MGIPDIECAVVRAAFPNPRSFSDVRAAGIGYPMPSNCYCVFGAYMKAVDPNGRNTTAFPDEATATEWIADKLDIWPDDYSEHLVTLSEMAEEVIRLNDDRKFDEAWAALGAFIEEART